MPEGDTIHRAAATLHRALAGHAITRFESRYAHLSVVDDQSPIVGRMLERVESRGKHVLMWMTGPLVLRTHMRMSGSWHIYRLDERWRLSRSRARLLVGTAHFVAVGFDVPDAEFLSGHARARSRTLALLGPDLLGDGFDRLEALRRLRAGDDREIGVALLDQRAMAGVGNVFKSEVLFAARVHPFTPVSRLDDATLLVIIDLARQMLQANVTAPGDTLVTRTGGRRTTGHADPASRLWVSGRVGRPCRRCATPIELRKQGNDARVTCWCPACQPQRS